MARWWAAAAPPPLADRLAHEQAWFREKLFRCPDDDDDGRQLSLSLSLSFSLSLSLEACNAAFPVAGWKRLKSC